MNNHAIIDHVRSSAAVARHQLLPAVRGVSEPAGAMGQGPDQIPASVPASDQPVVVEASQSSDVPIAQANRPRPPTMALRGQCCEFILCGAFWKKAGDVWRAFDAAKKVGQFRHLPGMVCKVVKVARLNMFHIYVNQTHCDTALNTLSAWIDWQNRRNKTACSVRQSRNWWKRTAHSRRRKAAAQEDAGLVADGGNLVGVGDAGVVVNADGGSSVGGDVGVGVDDDSGELNGGVAGDDSDSDWEEYVHEGCCVLAPPIDVQAPPSHEIACESDSDWEEYTHEGCQVMAPPIGIQAPLDHDGGDVAVNAQRQRDVLEAASRCANINAARALFDLSSESQVFNDACVRVNAQRVDIDAVYGLASASSVTEWANAQSRRSHCQASRDCRKFARQLRLIKACVAHQRAGMQPYYGWYPQRGNLDGETSVAGSGLLCGSGSQVLCDASVGVADTVCDSSTGLDVPAAAIADASDDDWHVVCGNRASRERQPFNRIATFNVNSLTGKRPRVDSMLRRKEWDVLGLTETCVRAEKDFVFRPNGYVAFTRQAKPGSGTRGLTLLVNNAFCCSEVAHTGDDYHLWVKMVLQGRATPVLLCLVYFPCEGSVRRRLMRTLRTEVSRLRSQGDVVVMGDLNMSGVRKLASLKSSLGLFEPEWATDNRTYHHAGTPISALDTILVCGNIAQSLEDTHERLWAHSDVDISDHFPVSVCIHGMPGVSEIGMRHLHKPVCINVHKLQESWDTFACHNRWNVLHTQFVDAQDVEDPDVDDLADAFTHATAAVARDVGCERGERTLETGHRAKSVYGRPSWRVVGARRKRREAWRQLRARSGRRGVKAALQCWKGACQQAVVVEKEDRQTKWLRFVESGLVALRNGQGRAFWNWARRLGASGRSSQRLGPVRDKMGNLAMGGMAARKVWAAHFTPLLDPLAAGDNGAVSDADSDMSDVDAEECVSDGPYASAPGRASIRPTVDADELNRDISEDELEGVLRKLPMGKATGEDGVPYEMLRGLSREQPLFKALISLLGIVWQSGYVPVEWCKALLMPIPKKGDLTDPNNYRGISLMSVVVKVLSRVLTNRLSDQLENNGVLCMEQGGFRRRREVLSQVLALIEVCERRRAVGLDTVVTFLDLHKAYDTVPHNTLWTKLGACGMRGKALRFFQSLYEKSTCRVMTSAGPTDVIHVRQGVKQGGVASPLLFDVFINDIFGDEGMPRCAVPGVDGTAVLGVGGGIPGLLFADDTVLLNEDVGSAQVSLNMVGSWATRNHMQFGIPKCGAFIVKGVVPARAIDGLVAVGSNGSVNPESGAIGGGGVGAHPHTLTLQGQTIPWCDSYRYLGIVLTPALDPREEIEERVARTKGAYGQVACLLHSASMPLDSKLLIYKSLVLPVALWGAEWWAGSATRCQPIQSVVNRHLRLMLGLTIGTPLGALWAEAGVSSVHAMAVSRQGRWLVKSWNLTDNWIHVLLHNLCFRRGGKRPVLERMVVNQRGLATRLGVNVPAWTSDVTGRHTRNAVREAIASNVLTRQLDHSTMLVDYWEKFGPDGVSLRKLTRRLRQEDSIALGAWQAVRDICKMRCGVYPTAKRLTLYGVLDASWNATCWACGACGGESQTHMLIECAEWNDLRGAMWAECVAQVVGDDRAKVQALVDAGSVEQQYNFLLGGRIVVGSSADNRGLCGARLCVYPTVACFIRRLVCRRWALFREVRNQ